ncbi:hypothetical protein HKCCE2091_13560 [Rhodobacterales bacterium HKCCE2091]|nr:hypothetical protein [Rhodobacterales bacterium HKCCE2091]
MANPRPKSNAGKSALLAELLGVERLAALRQTGALPPVTEEGTSDPGTLAWHRNRLIERFRERGFLGTAASTVSAPPPRKREGAKSGSSPGSAESKNGALKSEDASRPTGTYSRPDGSKSQDPVFRPGGLGARVVSNLEPDRLCDEHPAVVALLLRAQAPATRSDILRGLPGSQARAVMRHLRKVRVSPNSR